MAGRFAPAGGGRVGFDVDAYDPGLPLVIDPTLVYSTYLGGGDQEAGDDIAVDSSGAVDITGFVISTDFPTVNGYDATFKGAGIEYSNSGSDTAACRPTPGASPTLTTGH